MPSKPLIAITSGDVNGIGPEIILKSAAKINIPVSLVILGNKSIFEFYSASTGINISNIPEIDSVEEATHYPVSFLKCLDNFVPKPGVLSAEAGKLAMQSVNKAIELCLSSKASAVVTAPISKEAVNLAGYDIPGHTEYLAEKDGNPEFLMALINDSLRVIPLTIHIPIAKVATHITSSLIVAKTKVLFKTLVDQFGLEKPKISILGLNPHAGDGGILGKEEITIIEPAIKLLEKEGIHVNGPHPADAFFASGYYKEADAIVSMYHDQGLIPFKLLSFGKGVNTTLGLSFVRTSPDHGTAFNIAGKGIANEGSMIQAIQTAFDLAKNAVYKINS